jgi:hypothetical protein
MDKCNLFTQTNIAGYFEQQDVYGSIDTTELKQVSALLPNQYKKIKN